MFQRPVAHLDCEGRSGAGNGIRGVGAAGQRGIDQVGGEAGKVGHLGIRAKVPLDLVRAAMHRKGGAARARPAIRSCPGQRMR